MASDLTGKAPTPPAPAQSDDPLARATVAFVRERFAEAIVEVGEQHRETTIVLRPEALVAVCTALRDAPELRYTMLVDMTAVDWLERDPRYDVVYHLLSLETRGVVRLKVRVGDADNPSPEAPSVTSVWPAANWYEREVFDLFGIRFAGHPDLTRIQMPDDWVGHPLRKDYPLTGIRLPEPHWGGQVPFDQPLPPAVGEQTLRAPSRTGDVSSSPAPIEEPRP
jgi:NADH-quinone oxidoreductase subunit C